MSEPLPTRDEFAGMVDPDYGIFDPAGEVIKTQDRTHAFSILAGAFINSHHRQIAHVLHQSSRVGADPRGRTDQTLKLLDQIEFGGVEEAVHGAETLWDIHSRAKGTMDDGSVVHANEPDLLSVALVTGARTTAALRALMNVDVHHRDIVARRDELFSKYWAEFEPLRAAVGIPKGHLPPDPGEATEWWLRQFSENLSEDVETQTIEGFLNQFSSKAYDQTFDHFLALFHLIAKGAVDITNAVVYYAAPDPIPAQVYPEGVPLHVRAYILALPGVNRVAPDRLFGNVPRLCPHASEVRRRWKEAESR